LGLLKNYFLNLKRDFNTEELIGINIGLISSVNHSLILVAQRVNSKIRKALSAACFPIRESQAVRKAPH
jgi:hypothetical protein